MASKRFEHLVRVLYLAHLSVPAALGANCLWLWHQGRLSLTGAALLCGVSLWTMIALWAFLRSSNRERFLERMLNPLVAFYLIVGSLLCTEIALRAFFVNSELSLKPPGKRYVFHVNDKDIRGLPPGEKVFSVNNVGLRGPDLPKCDDRSYRIVTLGGSTTECSWLDDSEDWTHLMMTELNAAPNARRVWAANAGSAGGTSVLHLKVLQTLPVFQRVQMIILMFGGNDLQATLNKEGASTNADLEKRSTSFINDLTQQPYSKGTVLARSEIYRIVSGAFQKRTALNPDALAMFRSARRKRAEGKIIPLPSLATGLAEYHARIAALGQECRKQRLRCLFLTQPSMWRENLSAEEQQRLFGGGIGFVENPKGYGSVTELSRAIKAYNQTLLDTCHENGMESYDLASVVPGDATALYDDWHYNVPGARLAAHLIATYLESHPW